MVNCGAGLLRTVAGIILDNVTARYSQLDPPPYKHILRYGLMKWAYGTDALVFLENRSRMYKQTKLDYFHNT